MQLLTGEKVKIVLVEKPCWNYQKCNNKVIIKNNVGNKNVICESCLKAGEFHPDVIKQKQIMSERAKAMNKNRMIIDKRTQTLKNRTPEEIKKWKDQRENTLLKKDGEEWKQIQFEKTKSGMKEKYGKEYAFQIEEFKNKAVETMISKHGYENPMHNKTIVEEVFSKRDQSSITDKTIQTNISKYGGPGPMCSAEIIDKANYTRFLNQEDHVLKYLNEIGFVIVGNYERAHQKAIFKHIAGCGYEWETNWNNLWTRSRIGNPCPNCCPKHTGNKIAQNNLKSFLEEIGFTPSVDNRVLLGDGRELDFIIEERKTAIEYCGLYWHCDDMIRDTRKKINDPKTYHLTKLELCEKKGYRLITIFEDEWIEKKDIVKARLKQILNKSTAEKIHARTCEIFEITPSAKNEFLQNFHIQGSHDSSILHYGAFDTNNNLIAVMTFGKPRGIKNSAVDEWEIKRFCSDYKFHASGIAGKLLEYFKNNNSWKFIISYADRRWSNGNLYRALGFKNENSSYPAPWFVDVNKVKRFHRSVMWKTEEDLKTGFTQEQLAVVKGYKVIYDCGSLKYILHNK